MSAPILSAYDYEMSIGQVRHLRAGFLDAVNNGKMQFRWVWPDGTVEWIDLLTGLTSVNFNFANWWDVFSQIGVLLMVNGVPKSIYEWTGGVTTLLSTSNASGTVSSIYTGSSGDPNQAFMLPTTFGGKNYTVNDILTLTGGGNNATVRVISTYDLGSIFSVNPVPDNPGTGYTAGEILEVTTGGTLGKVKVGSVDGSGGVLSVSLVTQGQNYTAQANCATSNGGTNGQVTSVTLVGINGDVIDVKINNPGSGYNIGDTLTITGGGSNAQVVVLTTKGSGQIASLSISNTGTGYTSTVGVSLSGGSGSLATVDTTTSSGSKYTNGEFLLISGGNGDAIIKVQSVDAKGGILDIALTQGGSGYTTGSNVSLFGGGSGTGAEVNILANTISGSGCTVEITEVDIGAISSVTLVNGGSGYSIASAIPVTGGTGTNALMQILSVSANTITKQGTKTFAEEGFYPVGTHQVIIDGITYTVTGGWDSTTLTGVSPTPAGNLGDLIIQAPENTLTSGHPTISVPDTFNIDLIQVFDQQAYLGSLTSNQIYVSRINNYHDYLLTTPRVTGDPIVLVSNSPSRGFIIQEDQMYASAGLAQWYEITQDTVSTDIGSGIVINVITPTLKRLKTAGLQGIISQALMGKNKNDVIFVSNEPIVNSLGRVDNVLLTPQISDLSFPIVNDMNKYDFTDGCIFFWQNYILVAVPKEGLIRLYNMTKDTTTQNPTNSPIHYWEAPLTMPFSRFSVIDGDLYGHSYLVSETYKMFQGYNFNGHPIPANATFAYQQYGVRTQNKSENEYYIEGYISENAVLDMTVNYELDGFGGQYNGEIIGNDSQVVQIQDSTASLGKESLGKNPIGGDLTLADDTNKFRVIKTFPRTPYYEASPSFHSSGIDYIWSIIGFGPTQTPTSEGNNSITV